jgi:hypothetical protein
MAFHNNMLETFLKKIGVKSYEELNAEEKATYKEWEQALQGRKLTDKDVNDFLEDELNTAVTRVTEVNLSDEDEMFRKVEIRFIKKILTFLNGPKVEKEFAVKAIEQLTKI